MSATPCPPARWGLTGPHPNPLSDLMLHKPCGAALSLHRYAGRWVIVRVSDEAPDDCTPAWNLPGVDYVPIHVVTGPIGPIGGTYDPGAPVVFDTSAGFARRFPAIACPATFVIDPEGRLIAILDDHGWPDFLDDLVRQTGRPASHGAIDRRDLHS